MDWFINQVISAVSNMLCALLSPLLTAFLGLILPVIAQIMAFSSEAMKSAFQMNTTQFISLFPYANTVLEYLYKLGIAFVVALFIMALFRNIFSGFGFAAESPGKTACRFFIAIFLVLYTPQFLSYIVTNIFKIPYDTLGQTSGPILWRAFQSDTLSDAISNSAQYKASAAGFDQSSTQLALLFICVILLIMIAINFFKLLIEMAERYLMVNLLIIFSPLISATTTLESTMNIFKSFCRMFIAQCILLLTNVICMGLVNSAMMQLTIHILSKNGSMVIDIISILAFLRIAQHMDNYMRDLGMNAGITGGSMIDEFFTTIKTIEGVGKHATSAFKGAGNFAGAAKSGFAGSTAGSGSFAQSMAKGGFTGALGYATGAVASGFKGKSGIDNITATNTPKTTGGGAPTGGNSSFNKDAFAGSKPPAGNMFNSPAQPLTMGKAAQAQAMATVGAGGFITTMGDSTLDSKSIKAGAGGLMAKDTDGNTHCYFNGDPGGNGVTPFTGADGQTYFHQGLSDMSPEMQSTMAGFDATNQGSFDIASSSETPSFNQAAGGDTAEMPSYDQSGTAIGGVDGDTSAQMPSYQAPEGVSDGGGYASLGGSDGGASTQMPSYQTSEGVSDGGGNATPLPTAASPYSASASNSSASAQVYGGSGQASFPSNSGGSSAPTSVVSMPSGGESAQFSSNNNSAPQINVHVDAPQNGGSASIPNKPAAKNFPNPNPNPNQGKFPRLK